MKVTNICRKLARTLAAVGVMAVSTAHAAPLNTNLVVNPSFENVDPFIELTADHAVLVTDGWTTPVGGGSVGAYTYSQGFDTGADPPGAGTYYYTFPSNTAPATEIIDLSAGDSASLIASGNALFSASSWFSNYNSQGDYGRVTVTFKNGSTVLGSPVIFDSSAGVSGSGQLNWSQFATDGTVPVGTSTATIQLEGVRPAGHSDPNGRFREGYFDLVDFRVINTPPPVELTLTVNRANGNLTIGTIGTGSTAVISDYIVESELGALSPGSWLSIADNYDAGSPGPNQVDPNSNWAEVTGPAERDNLNEEDTNPNGAAITVGRTINLGNAWIKNYDEDLVFRYTLTNGSVLTGSVNFIGNGNQPFPYGDLSFNGSIGPEDYLILANNQHVDLTGKSPTEAYQLGDLTGNLANNHADFVEFKTLYNAENGAGSFEAMLAGVPEPSSAAMVVVAGLFGLVVKRRTTREKTTKNS